MKLINVIKIDQKGNLPSSSLSLSSSPFLRFLLPSPLLLHSEPFILHDLHAPFTQLHAPLELAIQESQYLKGEIQQSVWRCDHSFANFSGIVKIQVVFGKKYLDKIIIRHIGQVARLVIRPQIGFLQKKINQGELICQTLLPGAVGKGKPDWQNLILYSTNLGYNCFHLMPVLHTGSSSNCCCIADHTRINENVFFSLNQLQKLLKQLRKQGILVFTQVVLDKVNRECLAAEQGLVSCETHSQLRALFEIDCKVQEVCQNFKLKFIQWPTSYTIASLCQQLTEALKELKFWEYYQLSKSTEQLLIQRHAPLVFSRIQLFSKKKSLSLKGFLQENTVLGVSRQGSIPNLERFEELKIDYQVVELQNQIKSFNQSHLREANDWIQDIVSSVRAQLTLYLLNTNISISHQKLVKSLFVPVQIKGKIKYFLASACQKNPDRLQGLNFKAYLRREVQIEKDCLAIDLSQQKGQKKSVWRYFQEYMQMMSKLFDGVRIGRMEKIPAAVLERLIARGKKINPKLFVIGEINCSPQAQNQYLAKAGIDALQLSTVNINSTCALLQLIKAANTHIDQLGRQSKHVFRQNQKVKLVKEKQVSSMIFDQSHSEQHQPIQKVFVISAATSFLRIFSGSNYGVDFGFNSRVPLEFDSKLYPRSLARRQVWATHEFRQVLITFKGKEGLSVRVCGSWDCWNSKFYLNYYSSGVYATQLRLRRGQYQFKFIVDKTWVLEEGRPFNSNNNHQLYFQDQLTSKRTYDFQQVRQFLAQLRKQTQYNRCTIQHLGGTWIKLTKKLKDKSGYKLAIISTPFSEQSKMPQIELPGDIMSKTLIYPVNSTSNLPASKQYHSCQSCPFVFQSSFRRFFDQKGRILQPALQACLILVLECSSSMQQAKSADQFMKLMNEDWSAKTRLSSFQINHLLFSTPEEERIKGGFQYKVADRELNYCGLMGIESASKEAGLWRGLMENMKKGSWFIDHHIRRLENNQNYCEVLSLFKRFKEISLGLHEAQFSYYFSKFWNKLKHQYLHSLLRFPKVESLCLRICAYPFLSLQIRQNIDFRREQVRVRQLLIGLKGCLLLTQSLQMGQQIILRFSQLIQKGVMPSSVKEGRSRYDSLDTVWWYFRAVIDLVKAGSAILTAQVQYQSSRTAMCQVISAVLRHIGSGFKVSLIDGKDDISQSYLYINPQNGFQMHSKSGCSESCPIQVVALQFYCLKGIKELCQKGLISCKGVQISQRGQTSWETWINLIKSSFQPNFYVEKQQTSRSSSPLRHFYKDDLKEKHQQILRPNQLIGMALTPQLFTPQKAVRALQFIYRHLIQKNGFGVSLQEEQWASYDSLSSNLTSSKRNVYWVWLYGFYAKAVKNFMAGNPVHLLSGHLSLIRESPWLSLPQFFQADEQLKEEQTSFCAVGCIIDAYASQH